MSDNVSESAGKTEQLPSFVVDPLAVIKENMQAVQEMAQSVALYWQAINTFGKVTQPPITPDMAQKLTLIYAQALYAGAMSIAARRQSGQ